MHKKDPRKQAQFFDSQADSWDEKIWTPENLDHIDRVIREHKLEFEPPILDVGGGTGVLIPFIRKYAKREFPIIELDVSKKMQEVGRQRLENPEWAVFTNGDAHALPFPSEQFRTIIYFSAFPHFYDKNLVLQEAHRCLMPGGKILIWHLMGHKQLNSMHKDADKTVSDDLMPSTQELAELVKNSGFELEHVREHDELYLIVARKKN